MQKKEEKKREARYRVELTEGQLNLIRKALEFRFRIMLGQEFDLCNDMAFLGLENIDYSTEDGKRIFDWALHRRDHLQEIIRAWFRIAFEPYGYAKEKTEEQLRLEDMWDVIRVALGQSRWGKHTLHNSDDPVLKIEKIEG